MNIHEAIVSALGAVSKMKIRRTAWKPNQYLSLEKEGTVDLHGTNVNWGIQWEPTQDDLSSSDWVTELLKE